MIESVHPAIVFVGLVYLFMTIPMAIDELEDRIQDGERHDRDPRYEGERGIEVVVKIIGRGAAWPIVLLQALAELTALVIRWLIGARGR